MYLFISTKKHIFVLVNRYKNKKMKEIFKKLIIDSQQKEYNNISFRDYKIPLKTKKIVSLIGVRRSGKTFILYDLINKLRKTENRENIIFINFEDDRLFPLELKNLDSLIEGYFELFPQKRKERIFLFLDEVQNVKGWELFVRRIYDNLNIQIYITGSSSKLLSSEIATSLRGRTITYEIFPFSFKEYLIYKNINIDFYSSNSISFIKNAFNKYLFEGGFAETFDEEPDIQLKILKNYLDLIIYKDLIDRYGIKNHGLLKNLIKYLTVNMGTLFSVNKMYNDFRSMGFKFSRNTLYEYLSILQDTYAFFSVPVFSNSIKSEQRNPQKTYSIDNGFKQLFNISFSNDYSKLYENLVFLQLRRKTDEIFYFKQKQEIDFYIPANLQKLINVSFDINDKETYNREINSLNEGMDYFNLKNSLLITSEIENIVKIEDKTINILPLWKWLLT